VSYKIKLLSYVYKEDTKIPTIVKNIYLFYSYRFETLVLFKVLHL